MMKIKWNEMEKKIFLKFLEGGFGILDLRGKIGNSGFENKFEMRVVVGLGVLKPTINYYKIGLGF